MPLQILQYPRSQTFRAWHHQGCQSTQGTDSHAVWLGHLQLWIFVSAEMFPVNPCNKYNKFKTSGKGNIIMKKSTPVDSSGDSTASLSLIVPRPLGLCAEEQGLPHLSRQSHTRVSHVSFALQIMFMYFAIRERFEYIKSDRILEFHSIVQCRPLMVHLHLRTA